MNAVVITISVILIGYFGLRWFERANVWAPSRDLVPTPAQIGLEFESLHLETSDGLNIHAWHVPHPEPVAAMLFCHGNAGNLGFRLDSLKQFHSIGLDVLIFDYRGYGISEGRPSERGTYLDAEAAWQWLEKRHPDLKKVIFGRSLGGAVAVHLAQTAQADGLIVESGFTSIPDIGEDLFPFLPVRRISSIFYASIAKIGRVTMPVMVLHSPDDEIIPYHHGEALFEAAPEPKRFYRLSGGHNDSFLTSEPGYSAAIKDFIQSLGD